MTTINIHDPVAGKTYMLDPTAQNGARDSAVPAWRSRDAQGDRSREGR